MMLRLLLLLLAFVVPGCTPKTYQAQIKAALDSSDSGRIDEQLDPVPGKEIAHSPQGFEPLKLTLLLDGKACFEMRGFFAYNRFSETDQTALDRLLWSASRVPMIVEALDTLDGRSFPPHPDKMKLDHSFLTNTRDARAVPSITGKVWYYEYTLNTLSRICAPAPDVTPKTRYLVVTRFPDKDTPNVYVWKFTAPPQRGSNEGAEEAEGPAHKPTPVEPAEVTSDTETTRTTTDDSSSSGGRRAVAETSTTTTPAPAGSLLEAARADGRFTIILRAAADAGVEGRFARRDQHYTLFLPTDDAFKRLDATARRAFESGADKKQLSDLVLRHLVAGDYPLERLRKTKQLSPERGGYINVKVVGDTIKISARNKAKVIGPPITRAKFGQIFPIDTVMIDLGPEDWRKAW